MSDLIRCKGFYTTPLNPVSIPMFGSIQVLFPSLRYVQIYAEPIQEDRGTTNLSLSFSNIEMSPSHPYLVVSRINENGVRIPIYKSHVFDKNRRTITASYRSPLPDDCSEEGDISPVPSASISEEPKSPSLLGFGSDETNYYTITNIAFDNQTLLNFEKNCQLSFELWECNLHTRDLFLGSMSIPASSLGTLYAGEQHPACYNYAQMVEQRRKDSVIMKSNHDRVEAFKEFVEKHVNSVSACSLNLETLENIQEDDTHFLLTPLYSQDPSVQEK